MIARIPWLQSAPNFFLDRILIITNFLLYLKTYSYKNQQRTVYSDDELRKLFFTKAPYSTSFWHCANTPLFPSINTKHLLRAEYPLYTVFALALKIYGFYLQGVQEFCMYFVPCSQNKNDEFHKQI
jgi:hypothetical protein